MKTIVFDESCVGWSKCSDLNVTFLNLQRDYLNELLITRGYVYLNRIYETLGAKWNPDDENICYRAEYGPIKFEYESIGDGTYLVHIQ